MIVKCYYCGDEVEVPPGPAAPFPHCKKEECVEAHKDTRKRLQEYG